jgi:hypothetical protein
MPGQHIVQASSEAWPEAGAQAERSLNTGWVLDQVVNSTGGLTTNARSINSTSFASTGDGTTGSGNSYYALYRKVRVVQGSTSIYCRVLSSSYSTTTTETTVGVGDFQSATTALSTAAMTSVAVAPMYWGSSGNNPQEPGLRATGDMMYRDSTGVTRLTVGSSSQAIFGGTVPQWAVPARGYAITVAENAATIQTTSTSFVLITSLFLSLSVASTSNFVEYVLSGPGFYQSSTAGGVLFRIRNTSDTGTIQISDVLLNQNDPVNAAQDGPHLMRMTSSGVSSTAAKTIEAQWRTNGSGTATLIGASPDQFTSLYTKEYR